MEAIFLGKDPDESSDTNFNFTYIRCQYMRIVHLFWTVRNAVLTYCMEIFTEYKLYVHYM